MAMEQTFDALEEIWPEVPAIAKTAMIEYAGSAKLDLQAALKIANACNNELARRAIERALEKVKAAIAELHLA